MLNRREFVATAAAAVALEPVAFAKSVDQPLGVQLYTVRSIIQDDLAGTLAAIRKIGYRTVETFVAEYKMPAKDLRQAILDAGLTSPARTSAIPTLVRASIMPKIWAWNAWSARRSQGRLPTRRMDTRERPTNITSGASKRKQWA